ncbi:MAG TPA: hypothetical protein VMW49_06075 [Candidatus Dormibacteraeota bacterium]|nr:hypothetical protein [Candidatus Dormibacteraeota bacterium]
MSPKLPSLSASAAQGSGAGGKVQLSDIRAKLAQIRGEVDETAESAKPVATYAAVAAVVVLVGAAFLLGRRRGRRKSTWVEIRRR